MEVPEGIEGYVSKQRGKNRWLGSHQKRYLKILEAKLQYFGSREDAENGKPSKGSVDFRINECQIELEGKTSFKLSPIGGWKEPPKDNASAEAREFLFDTTGSDHPREKWVEVIQAHIAFVNLEREAAKSAEEAAEKAAAIAAATASATLREAEAEPEEDEARDDFKDENDREQGDEEGVESTPLSKPPPKMKSVKAKSVRAKGKAAGKPKAKSVREKPAGKLESTREKPSASAKSKGKAAPPPAAPAPQPAAPEKEQVEKEPVEKERARSDEKLVVPKNWAFLDKELPTTRDTESRVKRNLMFKNFDINSNGKIGVLEVKTCLGRIIKVQGVKEWAPAVQLAFKATRDTTPLDGDLGRECVSLMAFRILCFYMQRYIKLWVIFLAMNTDGDNKIKSSEFAEGWAFLASLGFQHEKLGSTLEEAFEAVEKANPMYIRFDEFAEVVNRNSPMKPIDLEPDDMITAICNQSYKDAMRNATKSQAFIDFKTLRGKFPTSRGEADVAERLEIWKMMDVNRDGKLTPFEVHQKLFRLLPIPGINDFQAPVRMAFESAKEVIALEGDVVNDGIGWKGFYALVYHLHCYVELWVRFLAVDHSCDRRVTEDEFFSVVQQLSDWGLSPQASEKVKQDHKAAFKEVDADESGYIRFFEFVDWCMQNSVNAVSDFTQDPEPAEVKKLAEKAEKAEKLQAELEDRKKEIGIQAPLIDWGSIREQFPSDWSKQSIQLRQSLFDDFDGNGNGRLVVYEVQNTLMNILHLRIRDYTPAVRLAFASTTEIITPEPSEEGFDYCEEIGFREFRVFLFFLVRYLELWIRFIAADSKGRRMLSVEEFSAVVTQLKNFPLKSAPKYGNLDTVQATFERVLCTKKEKAVMGFNDFARWCMNEAGTPNLELSEEEARAGGGGSRSEDMPKAAPISATDRKSLIDAFRRHEIDWAGLQAKLPSGMDPSSNVMRRSILKVFDISETGRLRPTDVESMLPKILSIPGLKDFRLPVYLAFQSAEKATPQATAADGSLDAEEAGAFPVLLRRYVELWVYFCAADLNGNEMLTFEEFESIAPHLQTWGLNSTELTAGRLEAAFGKIDATKTGSVPYLQFAEYCMTNGPPLERETGIPSMATAKSAAKARARGKSIKAGSKASTPKSNGSSTPTNRRASSKPASLRDQSKKKTTDSSRASSAARPSAVGVDESF